MKKVSKAEVAALYQFTRDHYVEYYDVQTELVDHLANAIEDHWERDPTVTFQVALNTEFRKFGVYGFSDVVEKRELAMTKKYWKLIWKEVKSSLKKPETIFPVLVLFGSCYLLLKSPEGTYVLLAGVVIFFIVTSFHLGRKLISLKKKKRKGEKVYLLEEVIYNAGGAFSLMYIPFHVLHAVEGVENLYSQLLMSFIVVTLVLVNFLCFYALPRKKAEILEKVQPELKFFSQTCNK